MLAKNLIPLLIVALIIFSSCQRETSFTRNVNNNNTDSIYLKEFVVLDPTLPSGQDTTTKVTFSYDGEKRVTQSKFVDYQFGPQFSETIKYFYSGSDTLPFKQVTFYSDFASDYVDTSFLSYSGGRVTRDSIITYDVTNNFLWGIMVKLFSPSGNNIFLQTRGYSNPPPSAPDFAWGGMIIQSRVNGNITSQDDTTTFNIVFTDRLHHQVSYDNKINPFYKVQVNYPILNGYNDQQKNNMIERRAWDIAGQFEDRYQYAYVYRSDGYPLSVTITAGTNPGSKSKGIYIYTD